MMKYRKKPVVVEAVLFDAEKWIYERHNVYPMVDTRDVDKGASSLGKYFTYQPVIHTLEGDMAVSDGDYIIKGVQDEFYPCKPDIFKETYEVVE
ncbi:hypothetical protein [Lactococcus petauri]|uniref:hypothetical protein n=1 Tax=Lactococcus petauri TaxID=1940789 RepID=UPI003D712B7A